MLKFGPISILVSLLAAVLVSLCLCGCPPRAQTASASTESNAAPVDAEALAEVQAEASAALAMGDEDRKTLQQEREAFEREREGWRATEAGWTTAAISRINISKDLSDQDSEPVVKISVVSYFDGKVVAEVVVQASLSDANDYALTRGFESVVDLVGKTVVISSSLGSGEEPMLAGEKAPERKIILKTKMVERSRPNADSGGGN